MHVCWGRGAPWRQEYAERGKELEIKIERRRQGRGRIWEQFGNQIGRDVRNINIILV